MGPSKTLSKVTTSGWEIAFWLRGASSYEAGMSSLAVIWGAAQLDQQKWSSSGTLGRAWRSSRIIVKHTTCAMVPSKTPSEVATLDWEIGFWLRGASSYQARKSCQPLVRHGRQGHHNPPRADSASRASSATPFVRRSDFVKYYMTS